METNHTSLLQGYSAMMICPEIRYCNLSKIWLICIKRTVFFFFSIHNAQKMTYIKSKKVFTRKEKLYTKYQFGMSGGKDD